VFGRKNLVEASFQPPKGLILLVRSTISVAKCQRGRRAQALASTRTLNFSKFADRR
jgi:hypothetical protein